MVFAHLAPLGSSVFILLSYPLLALRDSIVLTLPPLVKCAQQVPTVLPPALHLWIVQLDIILLPSPHLVHAAPLAMPA